MVQGERRKRKIATRKAMTSRHRKMSAKQRENEDIEAILQSVPGGDIQEIGSLSNVPSNETGRQAAATAIQLQPLIDMLAKLLQQNEATNQQNRAIIQQNEVLVEQVSLLAQQVKTLQD